MLSDPDVWLCRQSYPDPFVWFGISLTTGYLFNLEVALLLKHCDWLILNIDEAHSCKSAVAVIRKAAVPYTEYKSWLGYHLGLSIYLSIFRYCTKPHSWVLSQPLITEYWVQTVTVGKLCIQTPTSCGPIERSDLFGEPNRFESRIAMHCQVAVHRPAVYADAAVFSCCDLRSFAAAL